MKFFSVFRFDLIKIFNDRIFFVSFELVVWTGFYVERNNDNTKKQSTHCGDIWCFPCRLGRCKAIDSFIRFFDFFKSTLKNKVSSIPYFFKKNFQNIFHEFIIKMMANPLINKLNVFLWWIFVHKWWNLLNFGDLFDVTPRGVHSMFAIVELINSCVCRFEQFAFFCYFQCKRKCENYVCHDETFNFSYAVYTRRTSNCSRDG